MESQRFPGKPLADAAGHPLIWHAWHAAVTWPRATSVVVASPDDAILDAARAFGAVTQHTSPDCRCGSQRAFEVWQRNPKYPVLINLQADEPLVTHEMLDALAFAARPQGGTTIATLAASFPAGLPTPDPNEVKVISSRFGRALYFTRHPIVGSQRHIGVYAFSGRGISFISNIPESAIGAAERLEQLDWLDAGWDIHVHKISEAPLSVNTPRDLDRLKERLKERLNEQTKEQGEAA